MNKSEMLGNAKDRIRKQVERIKAGEGVCEKTSPEGDKVVVSLFHSAVWDISLMLQSSQYGDPSTQYPISRSDFGNPLTVAHKTKDGKWLQIAMPQYNRHYPIFMKAIGHEEMIDNPKFYPQDKLQPNKKEFYEFLVNEMVDLI